ncbi:hypothetical protein ACIQPR_09640 [Streptomyces sp. NPDC091280]|uniref:hypothetical protein n=1 Tax=Streptomyces sp. NPDC091280 TaxID=3365984 RepID=UPI00380DF78A
MTVRNPGPRAAVLYVCVERGTETETGAAHLAETEGRGFAEACGLSLVEIVTDAYGEPDPCRRQGWRHIRELAVSAVVGVVITRWPVSIAPNAAHDLRHREVQWLQDHGVRVQYSWAPMAERGEVS